MTIRLRPLDPLSAARIARDYGAEVPRGMAVTVCPPGVSAALDPTLRQIIDQHWRESRARGRQRGALVQSVRARELDARAAELRRQGLSTAEIAERMGCSASSVSNRLHRHRKRGGET